MKLGNVKKNGYPKITHTECSTVNFNELMEFRMDLKHKLHDKYRNYRKLIRKLHKYELMDECIVARLHELWGPNGEMHKHRLDDIRKVNRLRMEYKHERLNVIHAILNIKINIKYTESLVRDLHNIVHQIYEKYDSKQYRSYQYKLRLTYYDNDRAIYDAVVCKPIQMVSIASQSPAPVINQRFEAITPGVSVTENVSVLADRP